MKIIYTKIMILLVLLIMAGSMYSQGNLKGIITDSLSNDNLFGANVFLVGTALGSASNIEGEYSITRIPLGSYKVKITYIGYHPKEFSVDINSSATIELNFQLVPDIIIGEEVVVSAQALGQAAAINQQLRSNTIINVVSEQKIQELPDANAAESIGRLPGVSITRVGGEASQVVMRGLSSKFSTVSVDGVRMSPTEANDRGIDLSTISQGSLAGIELFKAITADKDADAIAGSVNLVTKKAPSGRFFRFEPRGSYNGLDNSAEQYNFAARYSERFFDDLLGLQLSGNLEKTIRSNEEINLDYELLGIAGGNDYEITDFFVTYANEDRKRAGGSLLLDFNTPDGGTLRFNTVFNQTERDYLTSYRTYRLNGTVKYDYRDRQTDINIFNSALHGENYFLGFQTNWNVSFAQSKRDDPLDYELEFEESSKAKDGVIIAGMDNVPQDYWKGPAEKLIPFAKNNFGAAFINLANERSNTNFDKEKGAVLDILRKYSFTDNITGEFKFGGKYREKSRYNSPLEYRATYYLYNYPDFLYTRLEDGTVVPRSLSGTMFENLSMDNFKVLFPNFLNASPENRDVYDKYALYPLINRDALKLWRQLELNGVDKGGTKELYDRNNFLDGNYYEVTERTLAGYAMNTLNITNMLTLITGLRVERDNHDYSSRYSPRALGGFPFPQGELRDTTANFTKTYVLPNINTIIRPTDFMNVRLAAYQAMARPDFNFRLLKFIIEDASGAELNVGRTNLKNAVAWNFEVQTQFYGNDIGLFSLSGFYKEIKDMYHFADAGGLKGTDVLDSLGIEWRGFTPTGQFPINLNSEYLLHFPYNSDRPTKVWGFEVEHQANFRFLPGLLKNIVLNYNFTVVRSETWIITTKVVSTPRPPLPPLSKNVLTTKKQKLENQPELFGNVSLGYDYEGFSFRISLFYQGEYNRSFSSNQRSDLVQDSFTKLDIAMKQKITDYLSLSLNLNNITNSEESRHYANRITGWNLDDIGNIYGMSAEVGVRLEL